MSYVFKPVWQNQGVGAKVLRVIGGNDLQRLDPFLVLDHFKVRLPAGFPDHPHRGFETVTYMKSGVVHHQDFKGHKGTIGPGDVQWMTAGKGIVHAEMPGSKDQDSIGFQLWLNLKSNQKMIPPRYQQYTKDKIPQFQKDGSKVKIICGQWEGHKGPIKYNTPAFFMDIQICENGKFQIPIQQGWNTIFYSYQGSFKYTHGKVNHNVEQLSCLVLQKSNKDQKVHIVQSKKGCKFVLIGGQPLNQKVQQYGPFVMNTKQQIQKTITDYQMSKNGFQNRQGWSSKIRQLSKGKKFEQL